MYTAYFDLTDKPFSATPDPRVFYENVRYREAYATLLHGVLERKGFIVLTGEVGTGKTTLLRRLMEHLGTSVRFVFFYNTALSFDEIVDHVCAELELPFDGLNRGQRLARLADFLVEEAGRGGTVVLLLDEAQHLTPDVLENLRLMSNLETATEKLLQIALVGQPELETTLADRSLRQFSQRVAVRYRLEPLPPGEIEAFIAYRLARAGRPRQNLFTADAVRRIAEYTSGVPRLINIVCDGALVIAYASEAKRVTATMIDEVAEDLGLRKRGQASRSEQPASAFVAALPEPASPPAASAPPFVTRRRETRPLQVPTRRFRWVMTSVPAWIFIVAAGMGLFVGRAVPERYVGRAVDAARSTFIGTGDASPAASPSAVSANSPVASSAAAPAVASQAPSTPGSERSRPIVASAPGKETEGRRGVVVPRRGTLNDVITQHYGRPDPLILDLIAELNPHVASLDTIESGQPLWLPDLTLDSLIRKQADGSLELILNSVSDPPAAATLAGAIARNRQVPVVVVRRISPDRVLYRVAIGDLRSREAAHEAWVAAQRRGWTSQAYAAVR